MKPAVADATVLIYLAKVDRLASLFRHHNPVFVPEAVYEEAVVEGEEQGHADAVMIRSAIEDDQLTLTKDPSSSALLAGLNLTRGDEAVLATALDRDLEAVLTDDGPLRSIARSLDRTPRGTLAFLLADVEDGSLTLDGFLEALENLEQVGYRISPSLHAKAVRRAVAIVRRQD